MGYLEDKAAQLSASGKGGRTDWTTADVSKAFAESGLTPEQHYTQFGKAEGLKSPTVRPPVSTSNLPNTYIAPQAGASTFNQNTYLANKVAQLNQNAQDGRTNWTPGEVYQAMGASGMTPEEHFEQFGRAENINPYQGVLPAQIAPAGQQAYSGVLAANPIMRSGIDYVDPERSTVAGQLGTLLGSESPYIREARRRSAAAGEARGMLNTSMAAGAGELAAIQGGLPIAAQDASTYAAAQGRQQEGDIGSTLQGQQIQATSALSAQNSYQNRVMAGEVFGYDTAKIAQGIGGDLSKIDASGTIQKALDSQAQDNQVKIQQMGLDAQASNLLTQIMGSYELGLLNSVSQMLNNIDITDKAGVLEILKGFSGDITLGSGAFKTSLV